MKKLSILGLCLVAALSASAQKSLVKEVEGKAKALTPTSRQHATC